MTQIFKKVSLFVLAVAALLLVSAQAVAAVPVAPVTIVASAQECRDSGGTPASFDEENVCCPNAESAVSGTTCFFGKYINPVIALLSAAVMIVVIISIIVAGIQYSSAQGDPSKIQAAKQRIINSLIALFAFIFLFAALNWLIPGGLI